MISYILFFCQATLEGKVEPLPEVKTDSEEATAERQQLLDSQLQQQVRVSFLMSHADIVSLRQTCVS